MQFLSLDKSSNNADIIIKPMTMHLLTYPDDDITSRAINRELKEMVDEKEFTKYYDSKGKIIEEKNKKIQKKELNNEKNKQLVLHIMSFRQVHTKYYEVFLYSYLKDQK